MKKIVFITKSLNLDCIKDGYIETSSSAFEYGLVSALNKKIELNIIYLGMSNLKMRKVGKFNFSSINYKSNFGLFRLIKEIIINRDSSQLKIISTGYCLTDIGIIVTLSKVFNFKNYCYIYDNHRQAIFKMPFFKKTLVDVYFKLGFIVAKKSSGLFVLNDSFIKKYSIQTPYFKTKIGVNDKINIGGENELSGLPLNNIKKIFVFAGTINSENGVGLIVEFLNKYNIFGFEIHFYGDGQDASIIQILENVDTRVKYFGRIADGELHKKLIEADFLINLRDPNGFSVDYSFPSKLIKFMSTGTPVISNKFPGLDDCYANNLHLFEEYSVEAVSRTIQSLLMTEADRSIGTAAKQLVGRENNWYKISDEIINFME